MTTTNPTTDLFNQAEELTGSYPSGDAIRSAIYAVMTKKITVAYMVETYDMAQESLESLARTYEATRGIHLHLAAWSGVDAEPCNEDCNRPGTKSRQRDGNRFKCYRYD